MITDALQFGALLAIGFFFGHAYKQVLGYLDTYAKLISILAVLLAIGIYIFYKLKKKRKLKIPYNAVDEYITASKYYPMAKVQDIISWLRELNVRVLGIDNYSASESELLKELIFKILH